MDENAMAAVLVELARACGSEHEADGVVRAAAPLLARLSGADVVAVGPPGMGDDDGAAVLGDGVARTATHTLPAGAGVLVLGWSQPPAVADAGESPALAAALAVVDAAVSRIDAEVRLADLESRVDNAQQLANMGDYDWHIPTDTNRWSDQLYRIYGHEPQSFNASYERFLSLLHPDDREHIVAIHQQAYGSGEPYQMIERIVRPDGQVRYLSSNGQVIRDETGTPVRMRGTCIDITSRVLAEQERERTAARFRALVEASPDAILVVDAGGRVVQANGHAEALLGADPTGHAVAELLPGGQASGQAVEGTGLDGRQLLLDMTMAPLAGSDDDDAVAVFLRDATPRLAGESVAAALREADVRRRQALELNDTVVQGLTAGLYCLAEGEEASATSFLERTLAAARRMMNDWLHPLGGTDLQPGDLVRLSASSLDDGMPVAEPPPGTPAATPGRPRVLVVDDNDHVRRLVTDRIASMGPYEVVGEAADGVEAVRLAGELQPHVVLLDLAMPRMDGLQALPLIIDSVPGVRVIVLSGFDESTMAEKALAAGAARYVEKGLRMDLADVIDAVLAA